MELELFLKEYIIMEMVYQPIKVENGQEKEVVNLMDQN